MARTKTKTKGGTDPVIRRVKSKEDRKRPSVFMRLKTDEAFKGIALFEPDPELDNNPGYFEYYDHYDKQANQYVPCAGEKCPFCAANDNPSTRALTAWYFPDAGDKKDQVKIFTMNYSTINDTSDESEDEDGILGKLVRIKRLSDKGDYKVKVSGKAISKADLKKAMKLLEEKLEAVGEGSLEGIVLRQLKLQLERLKAMDALDDDDDTDDDDDEPKAKSRRGKAKAEEEDDDEDEDEEDDEDEDEEDDDDSDDDEEDDDEEESDDDDDDEEDDDDDSEDEDEEEESAEISGGQYEVVKVQEKEEIFDLKNDEGKVKMWLGEGVEVDYDEIKKGVTVTIDAQQDDEGDWIITSMSAAKPKGKGGKASTKKGGKKK